MALPSREKCFQTCQTHACNIWVPEQFWLRGCPCAPIHFWINPRGELSLITELSGILTESFSDTRNPMHDLRRAASHARHPTRDVQRPNTRQPWNAIGLLKSWRLSCWGRKNKKNAEGQKRGEQVAQKHMVNDIQKKTKLFDRILTTGWLNIICTLQWDAVVSAGITWGYNEFHGIFVCGSLWFSFVFIFTCVEKGMKTWCKRKASVLNT